MNPPVSSPKRGVGLQVGFQVVRARRETSAEGGGCFLGEVGFDSMDWAVGKKFNKKALFLRISMVEVKVADSRARHQFDVGVLSIGLDVTLLQFLGNQMLGFTPGFRFVGEGLGLRLAGCSDATEADGK